MFVHVGWIIKFRCHRKLVRLVTGEQLWLSEQKSSVQAVTESNCTKTITDLLRFHASRVRMNFASGSIRDCEASRDWKQLSMKQYTPSGRTCLNKRWKLRAPILLAWFGGLVTERKGQSHRADQNHLGDV